MDYLSFLRKAAAASSRMPVENITGDTTFEQLGMDSYAIVDFLLQVEQKYSIVIPDDQMLACRNLNDVVDLIRKETQEESDKYA